MQDCTYILKDGTRIELMHHPARKKPIIQLKEPNGECSGYAVFHDEASMEAFGAMLERLLRPRLA